MALTKAPTYGKNSFYTPVKPVPAIVKPKPVIPYLSGGAGGLATNPIYSSNAALNASLNPQPVTTPAKPVISAGAVQSQRPSYSDYFNKALPGDWEVLAAEGAFGTEMGRLRNLLTGDIRESLIGLGLPQDEKVQGEFGSYIDQDTITKAIGNKYSTAAQIAAQEQKQRKMQTAALAARGMLRSGQTTNQLAGIAAEGERGRFQAVQDFLTGARGGLKQLGETEASLQGDVATARANAAARLAQQYGWDFPDQGEEPAPAAAGGTTTVTKPVVKPKETAAQRALRLRSEALNRRYRL